MGSSTHLDPQWIVIDEWAGMWIPLLLCAPDQLARIGVAFVTFRVFDASKVWPVCVMERLPGARGIIADDVMAGVMSFMCILGGMWIGWL